MDYSNWIIPFGKHKFTALCRLPAKYLIGLYGDTRAMTNYPEIKAYIEANLETIKANQNGENKAQPYKLPCEKFAYIDEKAAKDQLKLIRQDDRDHKKPIRAYQCEKCGFWHLTSKELNDFS